MPRSRGSSSAPGHVRARRALLTASALLLPLVATAVAAAEEEPDPGLTALVALPPPPADLVVPLTFPAEPGGRFSDDYTAARSGGRTHCATDVLGPKHSDVYAAVGGTITLMPTVKPSYGYVVNIAGDDGRRRARRCGGRTHPRPWPRRCRRGSSASPFGGPRAPRAPSRWC